MGFDPQTLSRLSGFGARPVKRLIQKELLNEMSRQIIAGTLEPGVEQVIDVFDEPPSPSGFGGGTKIVVRKPVGEKEKNGNGKAKKSKSEV